MYFSEEPLREEILTGTLGWWPGQVDSCRQPQALEALHRCKKNIQY